MFIKLTTVEGPALINLDDVHAITPYVGNEEEIKGCDLWWKDHIKDGLSSGINHRKGLTYVEETLDEILAMLAGGQNAPR